MKTTIYFILLLTFFTHIGLKAQSINSTKRDTLYYLLDTARTPKQDKMIWISDVSPNYIDYHIMCPCLGGAGIQFHYPVSGTITDTVPAKLIYITENKVKRLQFIGLSKLIETAYNHDKEFNKLYMIYFIEHLPNGQYVKRDVRYGGAFVMEE